MMASLAVIHAVHALLCLLYLLYHHSVIYIKQPIFPPGFQDPCRPVMQIFRRICEHILRLHGQEKEGERKLICCSRWNWFTCWYEYTKSSNSPAWQILKLKPCICVTLMDFTRLNTIIVYYTYCSLEGSEDFTKSKNFLLIAINCIESSYFFDI